MQSYSYSQIKRDLQSTKRKLQTMEGDLVQRKTELLEIVAGHPEKIAKKEIESKKLKEQAAKVAVEHQSLLQEKEADENEQRIAHEDEMQVESMSNSSLDLTAMIVAKNKLIEALTALEEKWGLVEQAHDKRIQDKMNELASLEVKIKVLEAEILKLKQEKENAEKELAKAEAMQGARSTHAEAKKIEMEVEVSAVVMSQQILSTQNELSQHTTMSSLVSREDSDPKAKAKQTDDKPDPLGECVGLVTELGKACQNKDIAVMKNIMTELDKKLFIIRPNSYLKDEKRASELQRDLLAIAAECESHPEINKVFGSVLKGSFGSPALSISRVFLYCFKSKDELNKFCDAHQLESIQQSWGKSWEDRQKNVRIRSHKRPPFAKASNLSSSSSSSSSSQTVKAVTPFNQDQLKRKRQTTFDVISSSFYTSWLELGKTSSANPQENIAALNRFLSQLEAEIKKYINLEKKTDEESEILRIDVANYICRYVFNAYKAQDANVYSKLDGYNAELIHRWSQNVWNALIILGYKKDTDNNLKDPAYEALLKRQYVQIIPEQNNLISAQHLKGWQKIFLLKYLDRLSKKLDRVPLATWVSKMMFAFNYWRSVKAGVNHNPTLCEGIDKVMWCYLEHMDKVAEDAPDRPDKYPYQFIKERVSLVKQIKELIQIEEELSSGKKIRELIRVVSAPVREKLEKLIQIEDSASLREEIRKLIRVERVSLEKEIEGLIPALRKFINLFSGQRKNNERQSGTIKRRKIVNTVHNERSPSSSSTTSSLPKIDEESDCEEYQEVSNSEDMSPSDRDDDGSDSDFTGSGYRRSSAPVSANQSPPVSKQPSPSSSSFALFAQSPKSGSDSQPTTPPSSQPQPVRKFSQLHQPAPHLQARTPPSSQSMRILSPAPKSALHSSSAMTLSSQQSSNAVTVIAGSLPVQSPKMTSNK